MSEESLARISLAAKAMTTLDEFWWESLESAAILPAWAATRTVLPRELWNTEVSDAIAVSAVRAVRERLKEWAEEDE